MPQARAMMSNETCSMGGAQPGQASYVAFNGWGCTSIPCAQ